MKELLSIVIIMSFVFALMPARASFAASENKPLPKIGSALNDLLTGPVETPDNINESNTKGTVAYPKCTEKTRDDVGRGIAKVVGGAWKLLTFWYPED